MVRLARQLGPVAAPSLVRKLAVPGEGSRFACALLERLAAEDDRARARIVAGAEELARRADLDDDVRLRALALLTRLGVGVEPPALRDPDSTRDRSLRDLAGCLDSAADVARAADLLLGELAPPELLDFLGELGAAQPGSAVLLCDELLLRDELGEPARDALRRLRTPLAGLGPRPALRPAPRRPGVRIGRQPSGRRVVLVTSRCAGSASRWRALCAVVGAGGELVDARYLDHVSRSQLDRELVAPVRDAGYQLGAAPRHLARAELVAAARRARSAGRPLPRSYYLGRDLLGLAGEHLERPGATCRVQAALLARGLDLLARGDAPAARPLLADYVEARPDDPEGAANLGLCLLALGDLPGARRHLGRAAYLAPHHAGYHWNRAAAAHQAGRRGGCYLALTDYLRCRDDDPERRDLARSYVAEYERLASLRHPELSAAAVARREESAAGTSGPQRARA